MTFIDTGVLSTLYSQNGDNRILIDRIQQYKQKYTNSISVLKTHLDNEDYPAFRSLLHTFKGTSSVIGAEKLSQLLAIIEKYDDQLLSTRHEIVIDAISSAFDRTCNELEYFIRAL